MGYLPASRLISNLQNISYLVSEIFMPLAFVHLHLLEIWTTDMDMCVGQTENWPVFRLIKCHTPDGFKTCFQMDVMFMFEKLTIHTHDGSVFVQTFCPRLFWVEVFGGEYFVHLFSSIIFKKNLCGGRYFRNLQTLQIVLKHFARS